MTDSPTRTRGGRRPGAGRPKKDRSATTIQAADIQLLISDKAPNEVETAAQRHARMAVEVLVKKLKIGVNESARITAAKAILDRGYGKPAVGGLPEDPPTSPIGAEMRAEARKFSLLAIEVLRRIAEFGSLRVGRESPFGPRARHCWPVQGAG